MGKKSCKRTARKGNQTGEENYGIRGMFSMGVLFWTSIVERCESRTFSGKAKLNSARLRKTG